MIDITKTGGLVCIVDIRFVDLRLCAAERGSVKIAGGKGR